MRKTAILLMFLTGVSTILGFTRELVLSFYYGASYITDAYLISLIIPQTIIAFIGAIISSIYIPMYKNIELETSIKKANIFTSNIINVFFIICSVIVLVILTFTPLFVKIFASGFEGDTLDLTVKFTRISILGIFFSCLIVLFSNYLQIKNKFIVTGLMTIPFNLIIILSLFLSAKYNIYILSIGSVVALFFQFIYLIPFIKGTGYKYAFAFDKNNIYLKKMLSLSLPVMLGVSVYQINIMIDKTIASQVAVGGISILSYSNKVTALVFGIFAVPFATALYPAISKMGAERKFAELKETVFTSLVNIMLLVIPITVGTIVLAEPIIRVIYGRGAFGNEEINLAAYVLIFYSIGMLGVGLREILYRTFYSLQDTKTPLINAAYSMVVNILLNIILSKFMGLSGIAFATSISSLLCTVLLIINLRKKLGSFPIRRLSTVFLKIAIISIIMGFITHFLYQLAIGNLNFYLTFTLSIIFGGSIYVIGIKFMKIREFDEVHLIMVNKINGIIKK